MSNQMILVIVLMGLMTYMPRMIAMVGLRNFRPTPFWKRFLDLIPFAMLSVFIFPDALNACGSLKPSLVGILVAVLLSLLKKSATIVVLGAVLSVYIFQMVML